MKPTEAVDQHLESLLSTTEFLFEITKRGNSEDASARIRSLLEQREQQLRALQHRPAEGLTNSQLEKLRRLLRLGHEARQRLALQRELIRERISELRSARQFRDALKPFHRANGRRLNVEL